MAIKFYFKKSYNHKYRPQLPEGTSTPCVLMEHDSWNDYHYNSLYRVTFFEGNEKFIELGHIKLLDCNAKVWEDKDHNVSGYSIVESLEGELIKLDKKRYYTLGVSVDYYHRLKTFLPTHYKEILEGLNDIPYKNIKPSFFIEHPSKGVNWIFINSLMRDSEAQKILAEGSAIFSKKKSEILNKNLDFEFFFNLAQNKERVIIPFNFKKDELGLNRINVIIGKNGTGKTQTLSKFALAYTDKIRGNQMNTLIHPRPPFGRILAISYSLFDDFEKPNPNVPSKSYIYLGCKDYLKKNSSQETYFEKNRYNQIKESLKSIKEYDRELDWKKFLEEFISSEDIEKISKDLFSEEVSIKTIKKFSSGESIFFTLITNILGNIREESLLLIDELETHLHPDGIAMFIRIIYKILQKYDSYAIIATHSPIVLQQIPSKYIKIYREFEGKTIIESLTKETFGEDLDTITSDVFGIERRNENSEKFFEEFLKGKDKKEIEKFFDGKLSLRAKILLNSLDKMKNEKD